MKTTYLLNVKVFFMGLMLLVTIIGSPQWAIAKPVQVAVVPFNVHAEKDLSFLRDGIVDMLSSRLSWEDKVTVMNRQETAKAFESVSGPLDESNARKIGTKLGADYVLFGSITAIGESVSIDAKMVDVTGQKKTLSFFNQSQGMDQVIPSINLFASDINEKEFGRVMAQRKAPSASQPRTTQTSQPQSDIYANPEKLFAAGELQENQKPAPISGFISTQMANNPSARFWKSRNFKKRITGISMGDVDGDGKTETVLITEHSVMVYRFENKRFFKVNTLVKERVSHLIGVDVADINNNGYPEIFVTALNPYRKFVESFVFEFDGKTFNEIVKKSHWYFRVVKLPKRGKILLGQKQGINSIFNKKIFELVWQNSRYVSAKKVPIPGDWTNVMGVAIGDAINTGSETVVAYDKLDHLRIYDPTGKSIWKDGDKSGGSPRYFQLPNYGTQDTENHDYYPTRILIGDINQDGKNEVMTLFNKRLSNILSYRMFTHGQIQIRSWNGIGLNVLWRTRKLSGYFSDFAIGDFDNDGKDELVGTLVVKTGSVVLTTAKSALIAYELR